MRSVLPTPEGSGPPDHIGLAYETWAPCDETTGKVTKETAAVWLAGLAKISISTDYAQFFGRWKESFQSPNDRVFELTLTSRLLVGHGNLSATDVGLTVHHTWGVPMIPGSALKGLLAHYVDAVYGPEKPDEEPSKQSDAEGLRVGYRGNVWEGKRVKYGPGAIYRVLFGAPDAIDAGASAGSIIFHDALYVPLTSAPDRPFAVDVLTVHQKDYYNSAGKTWPNDFDNPNPVSFLTVRPKTKLLFAVSEQPDSMPEGSPSWAELVERLLRDALSQWGIGGKTSAGYGRLLDPISPATAGGVSPSTPAGKPVPKHSIGDRISVERRKDPSGKVKFFADDGFPGHFPNKQEEPSGDIGEKLDVWIANKNLQGYSLTRREPRSHDKGKRR